MFIVRPVKQSDLDQLYALAKQAQVGLTTLPNDKKLLKVRIKESLNGFKKRVSKPRGEAYLFVMENTKTKKLVGTAAVFSKVGIQEPYYTYEIKESHKRSDILNVNKTIKYLKLRVIRSGPTEIGTLFLRPSVRGKGCGRLLALSRYLFMAQYRKRFTGTVIAELRGVIDKNGRSPFWNAVCKHFFVVDFKKADLMVSKDKSFIAELIPKHPIYIPLIPISAQKVIGQVHKNTVPAKNMLLREGFKIIPEVDIFEAGPTAAARIGNIRTVKKSRLAKVVATVESIEEGPAYLIANASSINSFCVTKDRVFLNKSGITLTKAAAKAIKTEIGQNVRVVKLKD